MLDGDVGQIMRYYTLDIQDAIAEIADEEDNAAVAAIPTTTTTATTVTIEETTVPRLVGGPTLSYADVAAGRATPPVVNRVMVPDYYNVWAEFYGAERFGGPYDAAALAKLEAEHGAFTDEEIQRALNGDDGIDPISFWNFSGAPKPLFDIAQQHEKRILDDKVLEWIHQGAAQKDTAMESDGEDDGAMTGEVGDLGIDEEDAGAMDSEVGDLDIDEVAFGEEACKDA